MLLRRAAARRVPLVRTLCSAPDVVHVNISEAQSKTAAALRMIGWDEEDAALQAEIMTAAEVCGNNQGLVKMFQPELMAPQPGTAKPTIERVTSTSAVINGNGSPGMLAAVNAADLAVEDCEGVRWADRYCRRIQHEHLLWTACVLRRAHGQAGLHRHRRLGAPRVCLGGRRWQARLRHQSHSLWHSRAGGAPLTFDMATSAIALFGVLSSKAKGELLPEGVAFGKDGNFTRDPSEALEYGFATFGGHKGAGLALMVELLAGVLPGAAVLGQCDSKKAAKNWGHILIAVQPESLVDDFATKAESVMRAVKESAPEGKIRLPGESSARIAAERKSAGTLPIATKIWETICNTAEHGLPK